MFICLPDLSNSKICKNSIGWKLHCFVFNNFTEEYFKTFSNQQEPNKRSSHKRIVLLKICSEAIGNFIKNNIWLIEEISVRNCIQQSISCLHLKSLKAKYSSPEMLVKHNEQNHFLSSIPLKRHVDNWNDITSGICHSKCSWDGVHFH